MIFYDCRISFEYFTNDVAAEVAKKAPNLKLPQWMKAPRPSSSKNFWETEVIQEFNSALLESEELEKVAMLIYDARQMEFGLIIATDSMERITPTRVLSLFKIFLKEDFLDDEEYGVRSVRIKSLREITPAYAFKLFSIADGRNRYTSYVNDWSRNGLFGDEDFTFNFFRNMDFNFKDELIDAKALTKKSALNQAKQLMLDQSFIDELERIYSKNHPKKFAGIPIHYALKVKNSQGVMPIVNLLCRALYTNQRLVGRCVSIISEITERAFEDSDIDSAFKQAAGNTLVIEMRGSQEDHANYASCYHRVVNYFSSLVKKYQQCTQLILVEESDNPGFSPKFIASVQDEVQLVEIKEGAGNRDVAFEYLKNLAQGGGLTAYSDEDLQRALGDSQTFRPSDLNEIYENLKRDNLRNNIYTGYRDVARVRISGDNLSGNDAYKTLQEMIGLTDVKKLLGEIIDNFRVQKARSRAGLNQQRMSRHMVFTGNPGTAKTSVARLLAQILTKEGILDSGNYVECGRADLIGEYVGQTAPRVRNKFREARGGVLMIDEAYSLVDDYRNGYGDEAISTIVQEMENHREDVIVIFCGYPKKMKDFLKVNEGLRSRIAFHIEFPDYRADELIGILRLFVKNDGYEISAEIEEKCRGIFSEACRKKDFGNGRFVRNLWEQARLRQSSRICRENDGVEFDREILTQLKPEDFDVNAAEKYGVDERAIGFARKI